MYGWRSRIGLIVPANNTVIEPELYRRCPPGVSFHATKVLGTPAGEMDAERIHGMEASADVAVRQLEVARASPILYCCMATGIVKGPGWARAFTERLGAQTAAPIAAASDLTMQALTALGVTRVGLVTPYPPHIASQVGPFFAGHGFTVVAEKHLAGADVQGVNDFGPEVAYRLARDLDLRTADGLCILATDFRTLEALAPLERDLGRPAVSTNQAVLWGGLRLAGLEERLPGCGHLLAECPELPDLPAVHAP